MKIIIIIIAFIYATLLNAKVLNSDFLSLKNRLFVSTLSYNYIQDKENSYIHIDMKFKSPMYAKKGGISLAFPELKKKIYIKNILYYGFNKLEVLPLGKIKGQQDFSIQEIQLNKYPREYKDD